MFRHSHLSSNPAHFILEKPFERFAKFQIHLLRKSTDIVVALDGFAGYVQTFNPVRIDGSLGKPFRIFDFHRLCIKYVDETFSDYLPFFLRVCNSLQFSEEFLTGIYPYHIEPEALIISHHVFEFILAQKSVIDEDAGKALADCLVQKYCGD